jgi:hypothetical protein
MASNRDHVKLYYEVADLVSKNLTDDQVGGDHGKIYGAATCDSGAFAPDGTWLSRSMVVDLMQDAYLAGLSGTSEMYKYEEEDEEEDEEEEEEE